MNLNLVLNMGWTKSKRFLMGKKKYQDAIFIASSLLIILFTNIAIQSSTSQVEIDYTEIEQTISHNQTDTVSAEWYQDRIEMVIIVRDQEQSTLEPLAEWKTQKGVPTKIVNSSEYLSYPGADTPEKIRNCLRDYYLNYSIQFVLLAGDTQLIPIRYTYNPDTRISGTDDEPWGTSQDYKPTDYYYAELTGNWDIDEDGVFGESAKFSSADEINWETEVYVGRFPGADSSELTTMVDKTIFYEKEQYSGAWMNKVLMAGVVQTGSSTDDPDGEEEGYLVNKIIEESIQNKMDIIKLIETNHPDPPDYVDNASNLLMDFYTDSGNSIVYYAGHGSKTAFTSLYQTIYTDSNAKSSSNTNMPSLIYSDACLTGYFDKDVDGSESGECIGESLITRSDAGAIGFIGASRLSWFFPNHIGNMEEMNRGMSRAFFNEIFNNEIYQQGKALYEMKAAYLDSVWLNNESKGYGDGYPYNIHYVEWERKNVLTYNLLGDPEVDIYTDELMDFNLNHNFDEAGGYYEGDKITISIRDENNAIVKNAKLAVIGQEDGAYNYFTPNSAGIVEFRLPKGVQTYNYTITGHNMNTSFGSFEAKEDNKAPYFESNGISIFPENPTVDDHIYATINASDSETDVEMSYLIISLDNFDTYKISKLDDFEEPYCFSGTLEKLDVGEFSYIAFIYDYGGNSNHTTWTSANKFMIPIPFVWIFTIGFSIILIVTISHFAIKTKGIPQKYARMIEELS
jgi:hypothetical protein